MTTTKSEIRPGAYYDSVVLMQLQKELTGLPGVVDAGVVMATTANRELLAAGDLLPPDTTAKADDLLIVVKGESETAVSQAISQVDTLLKKRRSTMAQDFRPRSLAGGVKALPTAEWVLISVPGRYAAGVAREALDLGKHVFLYSDNVSLADEVALKQTARNKGLLVMGPDCGTAVINGVGLGFANRVRRGRVGLVGASGTGLQAVMTGIHNLGGGISQAIGTGGRDLKADVGASTAHQGLNWLAQDDGTDVIVLISKPPATAVAAQLLAAAQATGKPVVVNFIGYPPPARRLGNLYFAAGLDETAELAMKLAESGADSAETAVRRANGYLRALFSGGTLAYEATLALTSLLYPLSSNTPIQPDQQPADLLTSQGHTILDLGEDIFTQGRLHPMMDNDLRLRRLRQETADPETGLILLDVVLGEGAHPDPAAELAPAIAHALAQRPQLAIVALVVGTDEDSQDRERQMAQLAEAGAVVFGTISEAVAFVAATLATEPAKAGIPVGFGDGLTAVNVGLDSFYDSIKAQGGTAVQVDWRPPAGGNEKLMAILAKMK